MCVLKQQGFTAYLTVVLIQVLHSLRKVLGICYLIILLHHAGSKHPTHTPQHMHILLQKKPTHSRRSETERNSNESDKCLQNVLFRSEKHPFHFTEFSRLICFNVVVGRVNK